MQGGAARGRWLDEAGQTAPQLAVAVAVAVVAVAVAVAGGDWLVGHDGGA